MNILRESISVFIRSVCKDDMSIFVNYHYPDGLIIDLFLPQHELGIVLYSSSATPSVNLKKLVQFENHEGSVVHIWEDQWQYQRGIIESRLLSTLGKSIKIHGRQTAVKVIDNSTLLEFLNENHLQVPIKARYRYGLYHQNQLVAVASFSKGRRIQREGEDFNSFELMRFCSKKGFTVVGGLSKLIKHFIEKVGPDDIMTYVDKDWPGGMGFDKMGFVETGKLPAIEFWLHLATGVRHYPHRVMEEIDPTNNYNGKNELSDSQLYEIGYRRVYAGGSKKLLLKIRKNEETYLPTSSG